MYSTERRSSIIQLLEDKGKVDVNNLSDSFNISKETIRRDLRELEKEGLLKRTHGGAILTSNNIKNYEYPLIVRSQYKHEEKTAICKRAAELIDDNDTIFIDNSSTCLNILYYVNKDYKITVITNSIQLLLEYSKLENRNFTIISLGGIFRDSNYSLYGILSQSSANSFFPDKSFFSSRGISKDAHFTEAGVYEIEVKQTFLKQSCLNIFLMDSSKFDKSGSIHLTNISTADYIITDSNITDSDIDMIKNYDTKLLVTNI